MPGNSSPIRQNRLKYLKEHPIDLIPLSEYGVGGPRFGHAGLQDRPKVAFFGYMQIVKRLRMLFYSLAVVELILLTAYQAWGKTILH
jgi:hypothetical protein